MWLTRTFGFGGGRPDTWEPDQDVNWGHESTWLGGDIRYAHGSEGVVKPGGVTVSDDDGSEMHSRKLANPASRRADGPHLRQSRRPRRQSRSAQGGVRHPRHLRTQWRWTMRKTVALIAGGHTFGQTHGAAPTSHVSPEPEAAGLEQQGFGWKNSFGSGAGPHAITSRPGSHLEQDTNEMSNSFFENLLGFEWELSKSPAGAQQWVAKGAGEIIPESV